MNNTIIDVLLMLSLCDYRYSITLYYSIESSGIKKYDLIGGSLNILQIFQCLHYSIFVL